MSRHNAFVATTPGITPINSFRLVLDGYFDTRLGALPNRSYFSTWPRPFDYRAVTIRIISPGYWTR